MDKTYVINKLGGPAAVADLLGITRQAVEKWPEKVPALRVYQLRELRPDLFPVPARPRSAAPEADRVA